VTSLRASRPRRLPAKAGIQNRIRPAISRAFSCPFVASFTQACARLAIAAPATRGRHRLPDNVAMSALPLPANPSNFRDLAAHVRSVPVRPHVLFRSDHLGALDARDADQIMALGICRVLDFRGENERAAAMCSLPKVQVHSLAIEPTIVQVLTQLTEAGHRLSEADVVVHMQDTYRGFVRTSTHRFAEFFQHLLESDSPTVFHCTAGKDRTGFAAALVLHALGATREDVMHDYLLTNERLKPPSSFWRNLEPHAAAVLWGVRPEFLQAAFEAIDRDYGGLEGYLRDGLRIGRAERARLHALYRR
jgi:protein-tyrosine phosphatase